MAKIILDQACEKLRSITQGGGLKVHRTHSKKKEGKLDWSHIA